MSKENGIHDVHSFEKQQKWWWQRRTNLEKGLIILFLLAFAVAIAAIIASAVTDKTNFNNNRQCLTTIQNPYTNLKLVQDNAYQRSIGDYLMSLPDPENIRWHLSNLTKEYHPAGTDANKRVFEYIHDTFIAHGLDKVDVAEYQVLLSYPDKAGNILIHNDGTIISNGVATPTGPQEAQDEEMQNPEAMIWWNAFSKNGTAIGKIVYVNFCTTSDFVALSQYNIDISGAIVLCRYGNGWRGAKVVEAATRNASGVILYSDPAECGPPKSDSSSYVFPESIYMPPTGAQRGTLNQLDGDPETPLYPSKPYTYRWFNETQLRSKNYLPNIPVMPIGYGDATNIFMAMKNQNGVQSNITSFQGGLNLTYYLTSDVVFEINVYTNATYRTIQNVIGYIYGKDEPDRQILISNHVDAWTYGALDPNSGTAISLELSRTIMATINATGWRPRRTIVFCQWDAEEYGLIGSTEWVEEKFKVLDSRAVALVNVDVGVKGNQSLSVSSVPSLYRALVTATKLVPNPNVDEMLNNRSTVYDSWAYYHNTPLLPMDPTVPYMSTPGGGSDYKSFLMYIGVPVFDMTYDMVPDPDNYPLYHTVYEVDWLMENLVDQNFTVSASMCQLWGEVIRNLADSMIVPFNVTDYGVMMTQFVGDLINSLNETPNIHDIVMNFDFVVSNLTDVAQRFLNATETIQNYANLANAGQPTSLALIDALNSRLIELERVFIDPRGLPERPHIRHIVFASSIYDNYSGVLFSGVTDSLQKYLETNDYEWLKLVNIQITAVQYSLESAIDLLSLPPTLISNQ